MRQQSGIKEVMDMEAQHSLREENTKMDMNPKDKKKIQEMLRKNSTHNCINTTSWEADCFIKLYAQYSGSELEDIIVDKRLQSPLSLVGFSDGTAFIIEGLNFGYGGTGPDTLKEILMDNGVDEDNAEIVKKERSFSKKGRLTWERKTGKIIIKD